MYTVVTKIEWCDKQECIKYIPVGYTTDQEYCDILNKNYDNTFVSWLRENPEKSACVFFDETPELYVAKTTVMKTDGMVELITK